MRGSLWILVLAAGVLLPAAPPLVKQNVEFGKVDGVSLTLDSSVPDGAGPFPAVILVHGGGFVRGDKQLYVKPLFPVLTEANYTWFSVNYRLAPQYPFPAAVEDVQRAIQYVKSHAKQYKVDPQRIALVGESAGGYLVSYIGAIDRPQDRVAAIVSFYGPHNVAGLVSGSGGGPVPESVEKFWQVKELNAASAKTLEEASPIFYVHKSMPPFLLIHGTKDAQVDYRQSPAMCERMKAVGAKCDLITVENGAHGMGSWAALPDGNAYQQQMMDWLNRTMAPPKPPMTSTSSLGRP